MLIALKTTIIAMKVKQIKVTKNSPERGMKLRVCKMVAVKSFYVLDNLCLVQVSDYKIYLCNRSSILSSILLYSSSWSGV